MSAPRNIMVLGTASSVGKSVIAAALCRIFNDDGLAVAPFKAQNMALNSFVTHEGLEMGRAQVVQAEAARVLPSVYMNPVLLKPQGDATSQVIVMGKVHRTMSAREYYQNKEMLRTVVADAYAHLASRYEVIVLEGAGSPAEINLRESDIVNMAMAEMADAPVVLVADIDRGGVFASIVGTLALIRDDERERVKGIIINKFRGDLELLRPGISMLEERVKIPVLGVVPYHPVKLEDEDSVTERFRAQCARREVHINVARLPRISNFTDFDAFSRYPGVSLRFVECAEEVDAPDIFIIPGSKNTISDYAFLCERGLDRAVRELSASGAVIIGICGGYQMLGKSIEDPFGVEGPPSSVKGLGLLDGRTILETEKTTVQVRGRVVADSGCCRGCAGAAIQGYEIHMGRTTFSNDISPLAETERGMDGAVSGNVLGMYIHGIFDSPVFTRAFLNAVRMRKGLSPLDNELEPHDQKDRAFDEIADVVPRSIDVKALYRILNRETTLL